MSINPPFQVRTAGFVDRQRYHTTPGTRMGDYMLTVFLDGRGCYRNSKVSIDVLKGMIGLVPPEDEGVLMADPKDPYVHYFCRFSGAYAMQMAKNILYSRGSRFFTEPNVQEIAVLIGRIGPYVSHYLPDCLEKREALLAMALVLLNNNAANITGKAPLITGASITEYLRQHLAEPTDLVQMSEYFRINKSSLCRTAKRATGITVRQLHEKMKFEWAKVLLRLGALNVTEVACRLGYDDPFYFSRVFKKHTGISPKTWQTGNAKSVNSPEADRQEQVF